MFDAVEGGQVDPCFAAQDVADRLPGDSGLTGDLGFAAGFDRTVELFGDDLKDDSLVGRVRHESAVWPSASVGEVVLWVRFESFSARHQQRY